MHCHDSLQTLFGGSVKIRKIKLRPISVYAMHLTNPKKIKIVFPESGRHNGRPYFTFDMKVEK